MYIYIYWYKVVKIPILNTVSYVNPIPIRLGVVPTRVDYCEHVSPLCVQVALLFSLWTETVRPYLEIVDEWIVHGQLFDPAREFIIQRSALGPLCLHD